MRANSLLLRIKKGVLQYSQGRMGQRHPYVDILLYGDYNILGAQAYEKRIDRQFL